MKINKLIINLLILLVILPLISAYEPIPPDGYVDYGITYGYEQKITFQSSDVITEFECTNNLDQGFPKTVTNTGDKIEYICNFLYYAPSSGKGSDNINFIAQWNYNDEYGKTSSDLDFPYTFDYGYCPNIQCPAEHTCINHECVKQCGNNIINQGETCSSCPEDVKCHNNQACVNGECINKCGDGKCESGECSSCAKDCKVSNCLGNGQCDVNIGENCQTAASECGCGRDQRCDLEIGDSKGCYKYYCGDGMIDPGETQQTCCKDLGCPDGKHCYLGQCFDCGTDEHCVEGRCSPKSHTCVRCIEDDDCGSNYCNTLTNECVECYNDEHCSESSRWIDEFFCSPDSKKVMQKGSYINGKCNLATSTCTGIKQETSREHTNCLMKNLYCQNGKCGCDEGYSSCKPLKKCVKMGNLDDNEPCSCDFQCKEGLCHKGKCFDPINMKLSLTKANVKKGEETKLTLSINNKLNDDMFVKFTINKGTGASFSSSSIGADFCSGNQCSSSSTIGAKNANSITIDLLGESTGETSLSATITYEFEDEIVSFTKELSKGLIVRECGNGQCEDGETQLNCCVDCGMPETSFLKNYECNHIGYGYNDNLNWGNVLILIVILIISFGLITFCINKVIPYYKKKKGIKKDRTKCLKCGAKLTFLDFYCRKCGEKKEEYKKALEKEELKEKVHINKFQELVQEKKLKKANANHQMKSNIKHDKKNVSNINKKQIIIGLTILLSLFTKNIIVMLASWGLLYYSYKSKKMSYKHRIHLIIFLVLYIFNLGASLMYLIVLFILWVSKKSRKY